MDDYQCIQMKDSEDAVILKRFVEKERNFEFLAGLNLEFDQVRVRKLYGRPPNFNNNNKGWKPNGGQQKNVQGHANLTNNNPSNDENETLTHGEFKEDIERLKRLLGSLEKTIQCLLLSTFR
ncbi:hypothetical protein CK203_067143 [Vitis vinifera]|uniref:Uncharacterized protein n=1 Tax=Vitis vinifera TaxID=29760 RepID=A0A438F5H7_VITVI|nr:hypothetical protein CK203_067143 [Vitis vinifera]